MPEIKVNKNFPVSAFCEQFSINEKPSFKFTDSENGVLTFNSISQDDLNLYLSAFDFDFARKEQAKKELEASIDEYLDSVAKDYGYTSILSMCSYRTSLSPTFEKQGDAAVAWRDAVWVKAIEIQNNVLAGNREIPTKEQLIAELPTLESFLNG